MRCESLPERREPLPATCDGETVVAACTVARARAHVRLKDSSAAAEHDGGHGYYSAEAIAERAEAAGLGGAATK